MLKVVLVSRFHRADALVNGVRALRAEGFRIYDVYAPYPIHDLDRAMGIRRSRLPWVTAVAGSLGLLTVLLLQFYTIIDWPLNIGGKPDNSTLAFVPISFELTVLLGGVATVAALLLRARLYPGRSERLPVAGVTNDAFALVVRQRDPHFDTQRARQLLEENGAVEIEERTMKL
jgi:hypothetical protein